ncbi:hypothetical protein AB0383_45480 [Amycolatopsis sp. NPDC051373]|uniref:hypothetical protein n=1 Tax=Amycolatopsis sp. NPDC051373 TaxID=3155801 RepID=UPI00344E0F27
MALTRTGLQNDYATTTLPGLLLTGLGLGTVSGSAMSAATVGVSPAETGVASATVNTTVQIGGSIGVALLMSLSASAPGLVVTWPAPRRILGGAVALALAALVAAALCPGKSAKPDPEPEAVLPHAG